MIVRTPFLDESFTELTFAKDDIQFVSLQKGDLNKIESEN